MQQHTRQRNDLALAHREVSAAFAHLGCQALGQAIEPVTATHRRSQGMTAGLQRMFSASRGDIVILHSRQAARSDLVKRVIGVPGDPGFGTVEQGYLENSNVDPVKEITDLIAAQRAYEMNSKVIQAADDMAGVVSKGIR